MGLKIDLVIALMWFKEAAEGGDGHAQWRLGKAYHKGELDLAIDHEAALMWHQKAAEGGDEEEEEEQEEEEEEDEEKGEWE